MIKQTICFFAAVAVIFSGAYVAHAALEQRALSHKLIRLHVVANSDSEEDQALKLQVRDAVLAEVSGLTDGCDRVDVAKERLQQSLPVLEQAAQRVVEQAGCSDNVTVSLQQEVFPTRYYDTFTLPAGEYLSLRVSIGEGAGHNWWCVVFPSLCTAATAEDWEEAAEVGRFSRSEEELISGGEEKYVLKFKVLEWLQNLLR